MTAAAAISAKAAGPDYVRRWDHARTAWMHDHHPTPSTGAPAESAGTTGGLSLSALRTEQPAVESEADALARQFREQIDAQFATTEEPRAGNDEERPAGLNLSAFRAEREDNEARQAALALLLAAGPEGTGASAIARALTDPHGTTRQTVVGWLKTWTEEGIAVRVGSGTKTRYVHQRHASDGGL
jgi:hypothetical protein